MPRSADAKLMLGKHVFLSLRAEGEAISSSARHCLVPFAQGFVRRGCGDDVSPARFSGPTRLKLVAHQRQLDLDVKADGYSPASMSLKSRHSGSSVSPIFT